MNTQQKQRGQVVRYCAINEGLSDPPEMHESPTGDFVSFEDYRALEAKLAEYGQIEAAARKLITCKGRYHAEQNTHALAQALGITLPLPATAPAQPLSDERILEIAIESKAFNANVLAGLTDFKSTNSAKRAILFARVLLQESGK